jgi:hypothetical protein
MDLPGMSGRKFRHLMNNLLNYTGGWRGGGLRGRGDTWG